MTDRGALTFGKASPVPACAGFAGVLSPYYETFA